MGISSAPLGKRAKPKKKVVAKAKTGKKSSKKTRKA